MASFFAGTAYQVLKRWTDPLALWAQISPRLGDTLLVQRPVFETRIYKLGAK